MSNFINVLTEHWRIVTHFNFTFSLSGLRKLRTSRLRNCTKLKLLTDGEVKTSVVTVSVSVSKTRDLCGLEAPGLFFETFESFFRIFSNFFRFFFAFFRRKNQFDPATSCTCSRFLWHFSVALAFVFSHFRSVHQSFYHKLNVELKV